MKFIPNLCFLRGEGKRSCWKMCKGKSYDQVQEKEPKKRENANDALKYDDDKNDENAF